jgi:hypothetical protein
VITQWHAVESLMISQITRRGLIVAPARRTTDLLDELISHFDWPVLLQPSVRLLLQQIEVAAPHCLLFWLDETHEIDHALRLIARLRDRGPRPYRIAVAHQLRPDAEPTIRAAGVHSVLCTSGNITALVQEALLPLLNLQPQPVHADQAAYRHTEPLIRGPTKARASPAEMHPP